MLYTPFLSAVPSPPFNLANLPNATAGAGYSQTISAIAGTGPASNFAIANVCIARRADALPQAAFSAGTPSAVGTFTFTVSADDTTRSSGPFTASQLYLLAVNAPVIHIHLQARCRGRFGAGTVYNQAINGSGGTAPYGGFVITGGALPAGLTLSSSGTISGTPTTVGTFAFTVTAKDSTAGPTAPYIGSQSFSLTVGQASYRDLRAVQAGAATFTTGARRHVHGGG